MDIEKLSALFTAVAFGLLYLTGYSYLDGFYEFYDVPLSGLNFGVQTVAVHSFVPVRESATVENGIVFAIVFGAIICIHAGLKNWQLNPLKIKYGVQPIFALSATLLIAATFIAMGARDLGYANAKKDYSSINRAVVFGGTASKELSAFLERNAGSTTLHYLVSSSSAHIFIIKFIESDRKWVFHIPANNISGFRVYQNAVSDTN